ncbi:hypothetical protein PCE1_000381 [Barthelona sp. PCE]
MSQEKKIVVVGGGSVGKSALTLQLISGEFVEEYDPTIGDTYKHEMIVDSSAQALELVDSAGQESFASLRDTYMAEGDGFLLVYAVDSKASWNDAKNLFHHIRSVKFNMDHVPVVLAANKVDLAVEKWAVLPNEARAWARENKIPFIETSAKTNKNVEQAFSQVVREMRNYSDEEGGSGGCCDLL